MKTFLLAVGLLLGSGLGEWATAQVNISVNIGNQPLWGPTGYDYVNYYYLPDLNIYYNVPQQQWVYFDGRSWVNTTVLPPQYRNYDLYRLHKVVINDPQPYLRNNVYQKRYASLKGKYDQQAIRDSRDAKYYVINNHPMHGRMGNDNRGGRGPQGRPQGRMDGGHDGGGPSRDMGRQQHGDDRGRRDGDHRGPR